MVEFAEIDAVGGWRNLSDGHDVNYTNPQKHTATTIASSCVFGIGCTVITLAMAVCLYTASFIHKKWHIQHYTILSSWLLLLASEVITLACIHDGVLNAHAQEMPLDDAVGKKRLLLVANLLVIPAITVVKLALCAIYCKIVTDLWVKYARYAICAMAVLITVPSISLWAALLIDMIAITPCGESNIQSCFEQATSYPFQMAQASIGGLADLILVAVMSNFFLTHMESWKDRATIAAFVGNSLPTLGAAVARLVIFITRLRSPDTVFLLTLGTLCLIVEGNFIIIFVSIPDLRHFIRHFAPCDPRRPQPLVVSGGVQGLRPLAGTGNTIDGIPESRGESGPRSLGYSDSNELLVP